MINASTVDSPIKFSSSDAGGKKVVFCIPTVVRPYQCTLDSLEASVKLIAEAGWEEGSIYMVGCPYISAARSMMLKKAIDAKATVIVFIDHDLSWDPQDLLTLIETSGDVVAGVYRFKDDKEEYMGAIFPNEKGTPIVREDGCVKAHSVPAGFLKITREGVNKFMRGRPDLVYGELCSPMVDLFNHGAYKGVWYGEDYSFSRNWRDLGEDIWVVPNLNINHHTPTTEYKGNFHEFLLSQPGGSNAKNDV